MDVVYARVENNKVVEYPVYPSTIRDRGHRVMHYYTVVNKGIPVVDFYHTLQQNFEIDEDNKIVFITYQVVEKSDSQVKKDLDELKQQYKANLKSQLEKHLGLVQDKTIADRRMELLDNMNNSPSFRSPTLGIEVNMGYNHLWNVQFIIDTLSESNDTIEFKLYDNTFTTLSKSDLIVLKEEMQHYILMLYRKKATIEKQIDMCISYEQLISVNKELV